MHLSRLIALTAFFFLLACIAWWWSGMLAGPGPQPTVPAMPGATPGTETGTRGQRPEEREPASFSPMPYAEDATVLFVRVVDHLGRAAGTEIVVELRDPGATTAAPPTPGQRAAVRDGRAELEAEPGRELLLIASHANRFVPDRQLTIAPLPKGSRQTIELQLDAPYRWLEGRLLDAAHAPVADQDIGIATHFWPTEHQLTRTGADGRFRAKVLAQTVRPRAGAVVVGLGGLRGGGLAGTREDLLATPRARTTVALPLVAPVTELGDLVLEPVPLFALGSVVDDAGRPAAGVAVAFETMAAFDSGWRRLDLVAATTGADGAFRVADWTEPMLQPHFRALVVSPTWHGTEPREFAAGATDLELCARPCAALHGSLRLPARGSTLLFSVRMNGQPAATVASRWRDGPGADARTLEFTVSNLEPGVHELELLYRDAVLWRCAGLHAAVGEVTADARLQAADLRSLAVPD